MAEKKMFVVEVTRTTYSTLPFKVMAEDQQDAKEIALDKAGNFTFSEHDADYSATDCREVAPEHLELYNFSIDLTQE
jgi:hypothetical protein